MPTMKQKRVARLIIENTKLDNPKTGGEIVESSGYGVSMKKNPQVVLDSDGVKEELNNLGFSEEGAKQVVQKILYDERVKADTRINAAKEVFKVHGSYAPDKSINFNVGVKAIDPTDKTILSNLQAIQEKLENE